MHTPNHKQIFSSLAIITGLAVTGGFSVWYNTDKVDEESKTVSKSENVTRKSEALNVPESVDMASEEVDLAPAASPEPVVEVKTAEATQASHVEPEPVVEPVKSLQDVAEMYLDLSGQHQSCFDMIVAKYPERFTPDVMEQNIKALTVFAGICGTGILPGAPHDYLRNGAFFDSELAETTR